MNKEFRLKNRRTFTYVYKHGKTCSNKHLVLMYAKRNDGQTKIGFTVSKKIGNSVVRNSVRRRLKESFRLVLNDVKSGYTFIVLARKPIIDLDYHGMKEQLYDLLQKTDSYTK